MDYLVGVILILSPWIFDFADGGAKQWVPIILGLSAIVYSLLTDYEYSISRSISMRTHLTLDLASGVLLAASPWLFGFNDQVYLPHLILGLFEIGASLTTERVPSTERKRADFSGGEHRHAH
jgi:hypothetical protein